ncbi:YoaK family protein [Kineococcus rubinsiae]|uniref:YoaK family protein n=1 Tax=Kineococcus rubinsiae TaxID=2609562 RepID=UPI001AD8E312|nr:YoaK family protein [Kineococcus rubinsiae]
MLANYLRHPRHGPLPAILLLLTFGTGLVDALSILGLGRVFVANMTGNVVFIGFALAGAPGFSLAGSLVALAAFLLGASAGGLLVARSGGHRGRLLRNALLGETGLLLVALALWSALPGTGAALPVLGVAALALGVQNSVVRRLAVPDLTTTVLTMTLTGIGADLRRGDVATAVRRTVTVLCMLAGAVVGALVVLRSGVGAGLVAVTAVTVLALVAAALASRGEPAWALPSR